MWRRGRFPIRAERLSPAPLCPVMGHRSHPGLSLSILCTSRLSAGVLTSRTVEGTDRYISKTSSGEWVKSLRGLTTYQKLQRTCLLFEKPWVRGRVPGPWMAGCPRGLAAQPQKEIGSWLGTEARSWCLGRGRGASAAPVWPLLSQPYLVPRSPPSRPDAGAGVFLLAF